MKNLFITFFLLAFSAESFAQQTFTLSGTIQDKRGEPLPGVGVYVSDYKIATSTDNKGNYILTLKPGNYNILVQSIGYKAANKNIVISEKSVTVSFALEESTTQLAEVNIKPDPNRLSYLKIFKDYFIGVTENAQRCKILNSDVLRFDYDMENRILTAQSDEFLIIENKSLGYKIKYLLKDFQSDYKTNIIYYEGYPNYEDLPGNENQKKRWAKKRLEAYNGSSQHFFRALFNNTSKEEGFVINKLIKNQEKEDLVDSITQAQVGSFTSTKLVLPGTEKFGTVKKVNPPAPTYKINNPKGISILNRAEILPDTLVHRYNDNIKKIDFTNILYVVYTKEKESALFKNKSWLVINRPEELGNAQISLVNLKIPPVYFYKNGSVYNSRSMLFEGYWAWEKIADSVPMDYLATPTEGK